MLCELGVVDDRIWFGIEVLGVNWSIDFCKNFIYIGMFYTQAEIENEII